MNELSNNDDSYRNFLTDIKHEIQATRIRTARSMNRNLIKLYWNLGEHIVLSQRRHGWGRSVVERLANDLRQEFPNTAGFSAPNLWKMRQFFLEYNGLENLSQAVIEIGWSHNVLIMNKVKDINERAFYLEKTAQLGWSRNLLAVQIESDLYHRQTSTIPNNFNETLPAEQALQAQSTMKSVYMLDMLGLRHPVREAELEARMVAVIKRVMLELGQGFSFIGDQYAIRAGEKDYFIDLLFFSRPLQSLVAIELKVGGYKPEYAGKMNFYLNLLDDFVRLPHENPSIGIILCKEHDTFEVEYSLRNLKAPVGIADYKLEQTISKEYKNKLPDPETLKAALKHQSKTQGQSKS